MEDGEESATKVGIIGKYFSNDVEEPFGGGTEDSLACDIKESSYHNVVGFFDRDNKWVSYPRQEGGTQVWYEHDIDQVYNIRIVDNNIDLEEYQPPKKKHASVDGDGNIKASTVVGKFPEKREHHHCRHGIRKYYCKECKGKGICKHHRRRYTCKECGGRGVCEHLRQKISCRTCKEKLICRHGEHKPLCEECRIVKTCLHGSDEQEHGSEQIQV